MSTAPTTHEEALKRACLWLSALAEACDCEPDETTIKISVSGTEGKRVIETVNLGEDLRAFQALGAKTDLLAGAKFSDVEFG